MASRCYIQVWGDAQDLNEGNLSRFDGSVGADRCECVSTRRWAGVSFGSLDGGSVSLVSPKLLSCGFYRLYSGVERRTGLE